MFALFSNCVKTLRDYPRVDANMQMQGYWILNSAFWLQLKWEALFCAKDASLSKINAAMHVCETNNIRFYTMWTWLLFCASAESLVLPDLVSDVQAIPNGTMPAAAVPMPMPFPSAGDISAMSTEDARDRMTVYSGPFLNLFLSKLESLEFNVGSRTHSV